MNIQVDPTSSNLASTMLNAKIRPRAVVGYGVKIFLPSPPNYVSRSPECACEFIGLLMTFPFLYGRDLNGHSEIRSDTYFCV